MQQGSFSHIGEVVSLKDGRVEVSLSRAAACDGCHAKSVCTASSGKDESGRVRRMWVESSRVEEFEIGDRVEVSISYRVGVLAVIMAYIVPLVLFVAAIAGAVCMGVEQGIAAVGAFILTGLYYVGFYLCRSRFERVVNFEINKL